MSDLVMENLSIDELFKLLESNNNPQVVEEIQRLIHENFTETKDSWLVVGLYEYYASTKSVSGLQLLLNIKEPHDKMLCDKLLEGLRGQGPARATSLNMLGYVARKQPTWLYRIAQHQLFKELIKVLKTECDVVLLITGLLALLSLLPAIPAKVSPYLTDLFELFGRLASYKTSQSSLLPELHGVHLLVGIYAYFHRLYGMFPCNFLSWLRQQYPDSSRENAAVFTSIIAPLLATVKMHPLLVTQSRDHEKTIHRWRGLGEVHDVVAECSRYSLDLQESASREDQGLPALWGQEHMSVTPGQGLRTSLDPGWTPGLLYDVASSPQVRPVSDKTVPPVKRIVMDSPPEAAVEATPDNTPFATPVKEEPVSGRPTPSPRVVRNLVGLPLSKGGLGGPPSPTKTVTSPSKINKEHSPFRFPDALERRVSEPHSYRRDSLFSDHIVPPPRRDPGISESLRSVVIDRAEVDTGSAKTTSSLAVTSTTLLEAAAFPSDLRTSPIKFTSKVVHQLSPIKPAVERYDMNKKLLRVQTLQEAVEKREMEDVDAEVTSITDSAGDSRSLGTRHITPNMFPSSATTPLSPSSRGADTSPGGPSTATTTPPPTGTATPLDSSTETGDSVTKTTPYQQNMPPAMTDSVDAFVRQVRKRVKQISICGPPPDLDLMVAVTGKSQNKKGMKRSLSCPIPFLSQESADLEEDNLACADETVSESSKKDDAEVEGLWSKTKGRFTSGTQTDNELGAILPYEHLFPSALPLPTAPAMEDPMIDPYKLLDDYIVTAIKSVDGGGDEVLRDEIALLHTQLLYERQRREVLGARNRRLLGKTKTMRELEEQNLDLRDQLSMEKVQTEKLHDQLALARKEKTDTETERSMAAREQEQQIMKLQGELEQLRMLRHDLEKRVVDQDKMLVDTKVDCDSARSELFQTNSQLGMLKQKEEMWQQQEEELVKIKRQLVMLGEVNLKYRERLEQLPVARSDEEMRRIREAAANEVAVARAELTAKSSELAAANGRVSDLETKLAALENGMEKQREYLEKAHGEHQEALRSVEDRHSAIRAANMHLETSVLELQDRLHKVNRRARKGNSPSTDSLDVAVVQQSTSSSVAGSMGSDGGEVLRRALDSPPVHLERELSRHSVKQTDSPEVGSAHSVLNMGNRLASVENGKSD